MINQGKRNKAIKYNTADPKSSIIWVSEYQVSSFIPLLISLSLVFELFIEGFNCQTGLVAGHAQHPPADLDRGGF
jgi:hypothetical protein